MTHRQQGWLIATLVITVTLFVLWGSLSYAYGADPSIPRPPHKEVTVEKIIKHYSVNELIIQEDCLRFWPENEDMRDYCVFWNTDAMNHFTSMLTELGHSGNKNNDNPSLTDEEFILRGCLIKHSTDAYVNWLLVDRCGRNSIIYYNLHKERGWGR